MSAGLGWASSKTRSPRLSSLATGEKSCLVCEVAAKMTRPDKGETFFCRAALILGGMSLIFSDQQLQAYLDEGLPTAGMSAVEQGLRDDGELRERLLELAAQREAGVHGLGEIWRRHRLSCPARTQLGGFLLGTLEAEQQSYVKFHLEQVGCRLCIANLDDLQQMHAQQLRATQDRRQRFFKTSAGLLRGRQP